MYHFELISQLIQQLRYPCVRQYDLFYFLTKQRPTNFTPFLFPALFRSPRRPRQAIRVGGEAVLAALKLGVHLAWRSEEHTSELQSHVNLVCRLLLAIKQQISASFK